MAKAPSELTRFVVEPRHGWFYCSWSDVYDYRELLFFLAWRDIKVRYKQTVIGVLWAILQPLLMMGVFSVVFGMLGSIPSDGVPYPIYTFAALLPWQLFSNTLATASMSLVSNQDLIKKVYFPRILSPISSLSVGLLDFLVAFVLLMILMPFYGVAPTSKFCLIPLFVALALVASLGVGLWLSALNARFRDVQIAIPFLVQVWLFASPIVYSSSSVPHSWRPFYAINPMAGVIDGLRWTLFGQPELAPVVIVISALAAVTVLVSGWIFFHYMQDTFADVL